MNNFIEKYKTNTKFKAAIKLSVYFILIFILIAFCSFNQVEIDSLNSSDNLSNEEEKELIKLENQYNITIKINIDNDIILYEIDKNEDEILINKERSTDKNKYVLKNGNYYVNIDNNYILSSEKEVYDVIDYNYINIDTINNFLEKANRENNQYILYLNDIILDGDSNKYIVILVNGNKINIDYTSLMKELDIVDTKCNVDIEIKNKED